MTMTVRRASLLVSGLLPLVLGVVPARSAQAQERVVVRGERGEPGAYPLEVEVHGSIGEDNTYANQGFGAGLRLSIPLVVGTLAHRYPENVAISFGADIVNYDHCYYDARCGANYLMFPVAAQWNLFLAPRFSLLAEAGVFVYKGFFDGCGAGAAGCTAPDDFGVLPTLAIGARVRVAPNVALIGRVAYPVSTLGISFL